MDTVMYRKRALGVLIGAVVVFACAYLLLHLDDRGFRPGLPVSLYYYDPALDQGPGGPQCSQEGLVAVDRIIPRSPEPVREAVHLLLDGRLTDEERTRGLITEFPLPGVTLESVMVLGDTAILTFRDPKHQTSGGACRSNIVRMQIEATVKQFPGIAHVRFEPEDLFQP